MKLIIYVVKTKRNRKRLRKGFIARSKDKCDRACLKPTAHNCSCYVWALERIDD